MIKRVVQTVKSAAMTIGRALMDLKLLGGTFANPTFHTMLVVLMAICGEYLPPADVELFVRVAKRPPPKRRVREALIRVGRRGGKSIGIAALAVYLALLCVWKFAVGEVGTIMVLAVDRAQAKVIFRYVLGLIEASPILRHELHSTTTDTIRLRNGIEIVVGTADLASVRGRTLIACLCDEFAFWPPDTALEVLRAVRPAMASQPDAMLVMITSVYAQRGAAYELYKRYFGVDDPDVLVVQGTTRDFNPTINEAFIAKERERDPVAAAAEYDSVDRSDSEALLDAPLVDRATRTEPRELPYLPRTIHGAAIQYFAAIDVSGGRQDAAAAAVTIRDGDRIIVAACRRWPSPHDPVVVAHEVAAFLKGYELDVAHADQYGAELARSIYAEAGVGLVPAEVNRSEAYLHALPLFTSGRIEIPDDPTLRTELLGLERRTGRSGKDSVDHWPGAHDDLANAVALAAWAANQAGAHPITGADFYLVPAQGMAGAFIGSGQRSDLNGLEHQLAMDGRITID